MRMFKNPRFYLLGALLGAFAFFPQAALATISPPTEFSALPAGPNVNLSWTNPTDPNFASVVMRRSTDTYPATVADGDDVSACDGLMTACTDMSLADGTYYYSLFATDGLGDYSQPATASAIVDFTAPAAPTDVAVQASGSTANISWTVSDPSTDNLSIMRSTTGFPVSYYDSSATVIVVGIPPSSTSYADENLPDGTYYYSVFALDDHYNPSQPGDPAGPVVIDTVPPNAPTVTGEVSGSSVNLSWNTPTDAVSFTVCRSTTSFPATVNDGPVATGLTSNSYSDTGLADGSYYYSVFALDSSGNASNPGSPSLPMNIDTTGPAAPSSFSAVSDGTTVNLSWVNPSVDFASITIRRSASLPYPATISDGDAVASSLTSSSYSDAALSDGTYYYSVFALDSLGNASAPANASATVNTEAPLVSSASASSIGKNSAQLNAVIDSIGGSAPSERGFRYGPTAEYGSSLSESGAFSLGSFSTTLSSLDCGSTYHYQAYATNSYGTSYGADVSFQTSSCSSVITMTLVAPSQNVEVGSQAQYTMGIQNTGDGEVADLPISVTVSSNQTLVSIEEIVSSSFSLISSAYASEGLSCSLQGQTASCVLASLPAGSSIQLAITTQVTAAGPLSLTGSAGSAASNTDATGSAGGTAVNEPNIQGSCMLHQAASGFAAPWQHALLWGLAVSILFAARRARP